MNEGAPDVPTTTGACPAPHEKEADLAPLDHLLHAKSTTRGGFFEPMSVRKDRVKEQRRQARADAITRDQQRKRDERTLARSAREAEAALGRGARGAFHADSDAPQFEKLKGKHYNW